MDYMLKKDSNKLNLTFTQQKLSKANQRVSSHF